MRRMAFRALVRRDSSLSAGNVSTAPRVCTYFSNKSASRLRRVSRGLGAGLRILAPGSVTNRARPLRSSASSAQDRQQDGERGEPLLAVDDVRW